MKQSERGAVDPFIVMDVMEAARAAEAAGRDIVHMEVGQPGTGAPRGAATALADQLTQGAPLGYTVALGLPELRARIAQMYAERHGLEVAPERIVVTPGSSGAFILAFTALFETGARVGIGAPGYPSYRQILKALDMQPIDIPTRAEDRFQPVPSNIAGLDGLLVASPANPTGTMLSRAELSALAETCAVEGAAFISDEIYHGIAYEDPAVSALEVTDDVFVINSFSKYYSMTGWRVGWMVVPESHVRAVERLAQNFFICPPHAAQVVALAAMECTDELDANCTVYAENRRLMLAELPGAGFDKIAPPDGAFYIYADVSALTDDSQTLAREILDEVGVAVTSGLDFDPARGAQFLRFSYARGTEEIREGLTRLQRFAKARGWV